MDCGLETGRRLDFIRLSDNVDIWLLRTASTVDVRIIPHVVFVSSLLS